MAVTVSDHSIDVRMVDPSDESLAWDGSMYRYGNLFIDGYANPIKPRVEAHKDLAQEDTAHIEEGGDDSETDSDDSHTKLISSKRYAQFMRQDLMESILNPREQWRLIAYAVIALAVLMLANVFISLSAAGVF